MYNEDTFSDEKIESFKKILFSGVNRLTVISNSSRDVCRLIYWLDCFKVVETESDYDFYDFDVSERYVRIINTRFNPRKQRNVLEVYVMNDEENTDILANSECIFRF